MFFDWRSDQQSEYKRWYASKNACQQSRLAGQPKVQQFQHMGETNKKLIHIIYRIIPFNTQTLSCLPA